MNEQIRAVLFDAVGTVIYPDPDVVEVYAAAGRRHGSSHDVGSIRTRFRRAFAKFNLDSTTSESREYVRWRHIVSEVFDDVAGDTESLFNELWHHFAEPQHWALFGDVTPVWRSLRARNLIIGIASNFDARLAAICRALRPLDEADQLFCSSNIGYAKPRREFFTHVQRQLGIPSNQILMVGDNLVNDVEAARAAGWQAAWIQRGGGATGGGTISQLSQITQFQR